MFLILHDFGWNSTWAFLHEIHIALFFPHICSSLVHQRLSVRIVEAEVISVNMSNVEMRWTFDSCGLRTLSQCLYDSLPPDLYTILPHISYSFLIYLISFFCISACCYCTHLCNSVLYGCVDTGVVFLSCWWCYWKFRRMCDVSQHPFSFSSVRLGFSRIKVPTDEFSIKAISWNSCHPSTFLYCNSTNVYLSLCISSSPLWLFWS